MTRKQIATSFSMAVSKVFSPKSVLPGDKGIRFKIMKNINGNSSSRMILAIAVV